MTKLDRNQIDRFTISEHDNFEHAALDAVIMYLAQHGPTWNTYENLRRNMLDHRWIRYSADFFRGEHGDEYVFSADIDIWPEAELVEVTIYD